MVKKINNYIDSPGGTFLNALGKIKAQKEPGFCWPGSYCTILFFADKVSKRTVPIKRPV